MLCTQLLSRGEIKKVSVQYPWISMLLLAWGGGWRLGGPVSMDIHTPPPPRQTPERQCPPTGWISFSIHDFHASGVLGGWLAILQYP